MYLVVSIHAGVLCNVNLFRLLVLKVVADLTYSDSCNVRSMQQQSIFLVSVQGVLINMYILRTLGSLAQHPVNFRCNCKWAQARLITRVREYQRVRVAGVAVSNE